ncbi:MAG: murein hydrolase activator EnvC family protein [Planctomycetota bacterium]|jgi:septal ring factor EnvC (AmiA/AmiB activator)
MQRTSILLGLALVIAAPAVAQRPNINARIRENQDRLENIREERTRLEQELTRLRGQAYTIGTELENIERQKSVTNRIVNELDRQIGTLGGELDTVTVELIITQDALAETQAVLEARLAEIYKRGSLWIFEVLLAAESFGDLLSRYKYLYLVSRQDRALAQEVEDLRSRVAARRRELVTVHGELARQRSSRENELDRFLTLERRRQRALQNTRSSEQVAAQRLTALAQDEERLLGIIAALERERTRSPVADATITDASVGRLAWPVEGRVLYRFGRQAGPDDTAIRQHGLGIAVPVGTPVKAVAGGVVQHAGPFGTYGPTVLVEHGGGYYTLYLYLSRVDVAVGASVANGTVVGLSGGANSDGGPHIEFQIRGKGGIALDPQNWLLPR